MPFAAAVMAPVVSLKPNKSVPTGTNGTVASTIGDAVLTLINPSVPALSSLPLFAVWYEPPTRLEIGSGACGSAGNCGIGGVSNGAEATVGYLRRYVAGGLGGGSVGCSGSRYSP